jgi:hypothetical protein
MNALMNRRELLVAGAGLAALSECAARANHSWWS